MAAAWAPPPPIDYLAWAENNVAFGLGEPFPGPYSRANFPYLDGILQALSPDDPCRYVTFTGSAQCSKTTLSNIFALGSITMGRGTTLVCHPTIDNALRWSKIKLQPMMRSIPEVQKHFPQRPRDTSDQLLYKERADGLATLLITGANSPASLSQVTVNFQVQDDLSKWENNTAGDPELRRTLAAEPSSSPKY
jgi:phage terminase large subunit GpA-like protein